MELGIGQGIHVLCHFIYVQLWLGLIELGIDLMELGIGLRPVNPALLGNMQLVTDTRLYTLLCGSVVPSVSP